MTGRRIALGAIAFLLMLGLGFWIGSALRGAAITNLRSAVYGECHRQNVERVTSNRNNYAGYRLWQATITLLSVSPLPASKEERQLFAAFVAAMATELHTESWAPLSNCTVATDHPLGYTPPAAVPFYVQQPPPSAFTIGPNE